MTWLKYMMLVNCNTKEIELW